MTMTITPESLVDKSLKLVSPPDTFVKLNELINDPSSSTDDICAVVNADPALVMRVLKVVNSSFYGFPAQIDSISRAIAIIGTRELANLVLASSIITSFKNIPSDIVDFDAFWQHSIACAITAKNLAKYYNQRNTERFFTAGLLHNIGCLVMYQSIPELALKAIENAKIEHEVIFKVEQRVLGFDHTQVGEALLTAWQLPASLVEVVRYHHSPMQAQDFKVDAAIVHMADIMVSAVPFGHSGDDHVPPLDPAAWELLGLNEKILPEVLQQTANQLGDIVSLLTSS